MNNSTIELIEAMIDEGIIVTIKIVEMFHEVYYFDFKTNQKKLSPVVKLRLESIRAWAKGPNARMNETQVYERLNALKFKGKIEWFRLDY